MYHLPLCAVTVAPVLSLPHSQVTQELGKDTLLECLIQASPFEELYWVRDGERIQDSAKYQLYVWEVTGYTRNLAVLVTGLTAEDYGEYTCVAENEFGYAEDTMNIYGELYVTQVVSI